MSNQGFKADHALSYATIEREARSIRRIVAPCRNVTDAIPGLSIFENLDDHWSRSDTGERVNFNYAITDIPVEALTRYVKERREIVIVVSPDTYRGLRFEVPRARFALCHEIGHAILHFFQVIRMAGIPHQEAALMRGKGPQHPPYLDTEWQANAFSSAMLMPADGLEELSKAGRLNVPTVCQQFRVSDQSARYRLSTFTKKHAELLAALRGD